MPIEQKIIPQNHQNQVIPEKPNSPAKPLGDIRLDVMGRHICDEYEAGSISRLGRGMIANDTYRHKDSRFYATLQHPYDGPAVFNRHEETLIHPKNVKAEDAICLQSKAYFQAGCSMPPVSIYAQLGTETLHEKINLSNPATAQAKSAEIMQGIDPFWEAITNGGLLSVGTAMAGGAFEGFLLGSALPVVGTVVGALVGIGWGFWQYSTLNRAKHRIQIEGEIHALRQLLAAGAAHDDKEVRRLVTKLRLKQRSMSKANQGYWQKTREMIEKIMVEAAPRLQGYPLPGNPQRPPAQPIPLLTDGQGLQQRRHHQEGMIR